MLSRKQNQMQGGSSERNADIEKQGWVPGVAATRENRGQFWGDARRIRADFASRGVAGFQTKIGECRPAVIGTGPVWVGS